MGTCSTAMIMGGRVVSMLSSQRSTWKTQRPRQLILQEGMIFPAEGLASTFVFLGEGRMLRKYGICTILDTVALYVG